MIKKYIKENEEEFKKSIEDLKHKDTFYKQIPNLLTFSRLIGGIPAGILYHLGLPYISIALIALLWTTDAIDGRIARKYHLQSKIGADMDAVADKIMFLSASIPLLASLPGLIINLVFEAIISSINVVGRIKGLNTKTVLSGKIKTVSLALTILAGYLVNFVNLPTIIFSIMNYITVIAQSAAMRDYMYEYKRLKKEKEQNKEEYSIEKNIDSNTEESIKTLAPEYTNSNLDELKKEKDFLLSTKEESSNQAKIRTRKKNNNNL